MPSNSPPGPDPLRTGIFGIFLVGCLVLVSFGYSQLPFWPQGKRYDAFFTNAAGLRPGNDVQLGGYTVGKVVSLTLSERAAKVGFTVDRAIRIGDQTLAAIKTDTVLGQKSLAITPAGGGTQATIPLGRTTTPYTLNTALQDLGQSSSELDKPRFAQALQVLTDALHDATPQLREALDGVTALSSSVNKRDEQLAELLGRAKSVSGILAKRADQMNRLIVDGNDLFAELDARRQALGTLIAGIGDLSRQLSGFVADNRREIGPALTKLNLVLDNLNDRREHISEALTQLPQFSTALGEVVGSGPGFSANVYGLPPASISGVLLDSYFQPGKLPDSLADFLRGFLNERLIIRPKSP